MAVFIITSEPERYTGAASLREDLTSYHTKHTHTHTYTSTITCST